MATDVQASRDVVSIVQAAVGRHGESQEALIPILCDVNRELGYLPAEALTEVSRAVRVPASQAFSVASFYRMLSTKPRGEHVVLVCESAPCHVVGGREMRERVQEELGLRPGETSADGKWTLLATSCLGICGVGPVLVIDDDVYGNVTPKRVPEVLARYS